ncbi:MFS transporter [Nocardiopsis sp. MG754419]|uniref:MFS transporter n=1 Tax=Nocardiopsis sp. MG754419 TaxID=2259865 RepID=UPI001BA7309B|nr:MFS transporter [Nocardiopsis sp. MG754419]MBR8740931.1 MFS transporter [Nocardiopsis sp. MG754419]
MTSERPQPYPHPRSPGRGETEPAPLIRNQDFQALWTSRFFAGLGKESGEVAYPLLILLLVGSASQAGIIGAAQVATTMITAVIGGALADRADRRAILLVCDLGRLLLLVTFATILLRGEADVSLIIGVAVTSSALMGISNPVAMAAIKQLVPASQIAVASAQNQIRFFSTTALGAPVAGALFGLGRAFPFLAEAVCYLLSTVLILRIRRPMQAPRCESGEPWTLRASMTGFALLAGHPILRPMMCWIVGFNIAFTQTGVFLALIATADERGASNLVVGVTVSLAGTGGLLGALAAGPVVRTVSPSRIFLFTAWAAPVCALALVAAPGVLALGLIVAVVFAAVPCVNAVFFAYVASAVPDRFQGRALGAVTFMALLSQPVGIVGIGVVFDLAGPTLVFLMMAVVSALAALFTLGPTMRALPRPEEVAVL